MLLSFFSWLLLLFTFHHWFKLHAPTLSSLMSKTRGKNWLPLLPHLLLSRRYLQSLNMWRCFYCLSHIFQQHKGDARSCRARTASFPLWSRAGAEERPPFARQKDLMQRPLQRARGNTDTELREGLIRIYCDYNCSAGVKKREGQQQLIFIGSKVVNLWSRLSS